MGINTTYYKVVAFAIGAFFAGIAGGFMRITSILFNLSNFGFFKSFDILIFVVLGGLRKFIRLCFGSHFTDNRYDIPSGLSGNANDYLQSCANYHDDLSSTRFNGNERITSFFKRKGGAKMTNNLA